MHHPKVCTRVQVSSKSLSYKRGAGAEVAAGHDKSSGLTKNNVYELARVDSIFCVYKQ